jgi:hypothetical protein
MFNHQDQDLDPLVENPVKDSKGSDALRPNSLQTPTQRFASSGISRNSLQTAIDLFLQSRIQSVVLHLCRFRENQLEHGDHYNSLQRSGQERVEKKLEPHVLKKPGPSLTAGPLMDWEQDWAAISIGVETAQSPAHAPAGQDVRLLDR